MLLSLVELLEPSIDSCGKRLLVNNPLVLEQGRTNSKVPDLYCKRAAAEYKPFSLTFNLSVNLAVVQVELPSVHSSRPINRVRRPTSASYYNMFLGAFPTIHYKVRVLASSCLSVCWHVTTQEPLNGFSLNLITGEVNFSTHPNFG
jgi:hypothetical protein